MRKQAFAIRFVVVCRDVALAEPVGPVGPSNHAAESRCRVSCPRHQLPDASFRLDAKANAGRRRDAALLDLRRVAQAVKPTARGFSERIGVDG